MIFKKQPSLTSQTFSEEIVNAITHGLGAFFSIIGLIALIYYSITRGTALHIASCSFYGGSLVLLYSVSTLYHAISHQSRKAILRKLDHISIYLLITGTYTPLTLVVLHGVFGWTLFGLVCGFCIVGILFKILFGMKYGFISTAFYLIMGWLAIIGIKPIFSALSIQGIMWIAAGGIFYTLGVIFYATDKKYAFFHAIWHLFVLMGSLCHFIVIFQYVIP